MAVAAAAAVAAKLIPVIGMGCFDKKVAPAAKRCI